MREGGVDLDNEYADFTKHFYEFHRQEKILIVFLSNNYSKPEICLHINLCLYVSCFPTSARESPMLGYSCDTFYTKFITTR